MRVVWSLAALAVLAAGPAWADIDLPQASPAASVSLKIGTTKIDLEYHRPGVKGRTIWGGLVPFDQVWRLGANEATTIDFSDPVKVAGRDVPAGTYALFAVPGKESWTLIVSTKAKQWGAYSYSQAEDVLRFRVTPSPAPFQEWMEFTLEPSGPNSAEVAMTWEKVRVAFPVEVDVPALVWADIAKELAEPDADWEDYFQAAKYSLDQGGHRSEALGWADRALAGEASFWTYELKARLLHRERRTTEALALLERAINDSIGKAPAEYTDGLRKTAEAWKAETKR